MSFMSNYSRKTCNEYKIYMKGVLIKEVDSYKCLDTFLDNGLKGESQYSKLTKNLGFKLRTFSKIRKYLTPRLRSWYTNLQFCQS